MRRIVITLGAVLGLIAMADAASVLRPLVKRPAPLGAGKILLSDGVSFLLQSNAASKVCRAGGC